MAVWTGMDHYFRSSGVSPFPLALETSWTTDGWLVELIVVLGVTEGGHESMCVATYREGYASQSDGEPDMSAAAAEAMQKRALSFFATRLRTVLAEP